MRYLPLTDTDRRAMLDEIGVKSIDDLFVDVPPSARRDRPFDLPSHKSEGEVLRAFSDLAARNVAAGSVPFFVGAGIYRHEIPASLDYLIQRGEFLTSYTPYQPEIAQGTLQYLFEFQTQVAMIAGMEVANASMYDGATACAEAALMAARITKRKKIILSGGLHPHFRSVTETSLRFTDLTVESLSPDPLALEDLLGRIDAQTACVIVQTPSFFGHVRDYSTLAAACHDQGALLVVAVPDPVALGLMMSPGEMGADIVVIEGQSLGIGMNFGGPGLGLFATRQSYIRQMPGRLCGETVDADGKRGFVLTLSTREQHIRREKATSNICTNSGLCALAFTIHMSLLGEKGFTRLAELNHQAAIRLADGLSTVAGVKVLTKAFFHEVAIELPKSAADVVASLAEQGILAGVPASRFYPSYPELDRILILAATETTPPDHIDRLTQALAQVLS